MTTEQYSKEIYVNSKGQLGCSQQYIRKMIAKGKALQLPRVVKLEQSGKYHLLHID